MTNPTTTPSEIAELPVAAIEQLRDHQRQLDQDGTFVGVSRQAIDEVLTYISALRPHTTDNSELIERVLAIRDEADAFNPDARTAVRSVFEAQEKVWALLPSILAALEASTPHDAWREGLAAMIALRDDMLRRAEAKKWQHDGELVVECGNGVWIRFNAAIRALEPKGD